MSEIPLIFLGQYLSNAPVMEDDEGAWGRSVVRVPFRKQIIGWWIEVWWSSNTLSWSWFCWRCCFCCCHCCCHHCRHRHRCFCWYRFWSWLFSYSWHFHHRRNPTVLSLGCDMYKALFLHIDAIKRSQNPWWSLGRCPFHGAVQVKIHCMVKLPLLITLLWNSISCYSCNWRYS